MDAMSLLTGFLFGSATVSILWRRPQHVQGSDGYATNGGFTEHDRGDVTAEFEKSPHSTKAFHAWAENLLTVLGAPLTHPEDSRRLTIAERVEWLQAKIG